MSRFRYSLCMRLSSVLLLCGLLVAAPSLFAQQSPSAPAPSTLPAPPKAVSSAKAQSQTSAPATSSTLKSATATQKTTKSSTPPLRLESLPPLPHKLTPAQQKALRTKNIIHAINTLARSEARWGAAGSTPGYSLRLIAKSHKKTPEGLQISFTLHATGFKPGDALNLFRWPISSPTHKVTGGLTVDSSGQVICPEISQGDCLASMQPGDPVHIKAVAAKGEPVRVAVTSSNGKVRAEATVIPFPLEVTSNSCKMEIILGTKNASLVLLEGVGFPKSQKIKFHVVTDGQDHPVTVNSSKAGSLIAALLPAIPGHSSGTSTVSYHGATCSPSISFPWGKGSYHPIN